MTPDDAISRAIAAIKARSSEYGRGYDKDWWRGYFSGLDVAIDILERMNTNDPR